ncbi:CYFIP-related Rac1 interactor B [Brevipalpus obovatus]|uniref:CYFIP-related Rac1 interactor B n=1 Tax=Brevipalpus obovatus TaxID=246614 RepID=UPI003D9E3B4C
MGNLLRLLSRDENVQNVKYDLFVDFENAQPTEIELEVFKEVSAFLEGGPDILHNIWIYKGASNEIREAIANPSSEALQLKAWQTLSPLIERLQTFYLYSQLLESILPKILGALTGGPSSPREHLQSQQALVKQFAEILDFVMKFDDLKMSNPSIQNDLSYFRRIISRISIPSNSNLSNIKPDSPIDLERMNRMSLFYAHATPMLKVLSDTTSKFVQDNRNMPIDNPTEILSTMAKVCQRMVDNPEFCSRFKKEETIFFVLRVMVGVIILYDHIDPNGAFVKSSNVDIKGAIRVLKEQPPDSVSGLLNALRYTTKNLNADSTPKSIKQLLN